MQLIEKLNWRYATKTMKTDRVPQSKIDNIIHAIRLTASSYGLQPYKLLVIENKELREALKGAAYNQSQVADASHLFVFAAYDNITEFHIDNYMALHAEVKGIDVAHMAPFKQMLAGSLLARTAEQNFNWASRQVYIALGTALIAAAAEEVDATPMEGFNPSKVDEVLNLKEQGLRSVLLLPIGYRDAANDKTAHAPKVRKKHADFVVEVK